MAGIIAAALALAGISLVPASAGTVDRFEWAELPARVQVGAAVPVTLRALDAAGLVASDFVEDVQLSGRAVASGPRLLLSEVAGSIRAVEIANVGDTFSSIGGWALSFYGTGSWPAPITRFVFPPGAICWPGEVFVVYSRSGLPGGYPTYFMGVALPWVGNAPNDPIAVLLQDEAGQPIDFFGACTGYGVQIQSPVSLPPGFWQGLPAPVNAPFNRSYQRSGSMDHDNAADWVIENHTLGTMNPGMVLPFEAPLRQVSVSPNTVRFNQGVWRGFVTIAEPATSIWLHADNGAGVVGDSRALAVASGAPLTLILPPGGDEATPGLLGTGRVRIGDVVTSNVVVRFQLDVPGEISLPSSVVLPAGATEVTFAVTNVDDTVFDGLRMITVTASAPGYENASGAMTNADNEAGQLQVVLPAVAREGDGTLSGAGQIRLSRPAGIDLPIRLTSLDLTGFRVGPSVVVPAGQTTASFDLVIADDPYLNGARMAGVRAELAGMAPAESTMIVNDNEPLSFFLDTYYPVEEGRGNVSNALRVTLGGLAASNVVVNLISTNPDRLQVPPTMTIPVGQNVAFTSFTVLDDTLPNGQAVVPVIASAAGYPSSTNATQIIDNDLHHFTFVGPSSSQVSGREFEVTLYAHTVDGYVPGAYNGQVSLQATGHRGPLAVEPTTIQFANGVWQGRVRVTGETHQAVLMARDLSGHLGTSPFFLVANFGGFGNGLADLIYDPGRDQIVAGIQASAETNAETLLGIHPGTGAVLWRRAFGTEPGRMALASDQTTLYVGQNSTGGVARVRLGSNAIDLRFPLHPNPQVAEDIEVLPGAPDTVVVSRRDLGNRFHQGVAVYDHGITRPEIVGVDSYCCDYSVGGLDSSGTLFSTYSSGLRRLTLASNGVVLARQAYGSIHGGDLLLADGLLYSTHGHVFDPVTLELRGSFPAAGELAIDRGEGRIYFLVEKSGGAGASVCVYDLASRVRMATVDLPTFAGPARRFVRTGPHGLAALSAAGQLFLVDSPIAGTNSSAAGLAVHFAPGPGVPTAGQNFEYSLTVSNRGQARVESVRLVDRPGLAVTNVSAIALQGVCRWEAGELMCDGIALAPGAAMTVRISLQAPSAGLIPHQVTAVGRTAEAIWTTAFDTFFTSVQPAPGVSPVVALQLSTGPSTADGPTGLGYPPPDLVYDPATQRLLVGHQRVSSQFEGGLAVLDPQSRKFERVVPLPQMPGRLAISPEGRQAYVGLESQWKVYPYDALEGRIGPDFSFPQNGLIQDMEVQPGHPETVAISIVGERFTALYDRGVRRPDMVYSPFLEFSTDGNYLFGSEGAGFYRNRVTPTGLVREALLELGGATPFLTDMRIGGGLAYYGFGAVLDPFLFVTTNRYRVQAGESIVCPDALRHRVYFLENFATHWILEAYDTDTAGLVGTLVVPNTRSSSALNLVRWGDDGLAFTLRDGRVFLVQISGMTAVPKLWVSQSMAPHPARVGSNLVYSITVSNAGPGVAEQVTLVDLVPTGSVLVSAAASQGHAIMTNGQVTFVLGTLSPSATATASIVLVPTVAGRAINTCEASADRFDRSSGAHFSSLEHWVEFGGAERLYDEIHLVTTDLVWEPTRRRVLASVPAGGWPFERSVVAIDLDRGNLTSVYTGEEPGKLEVSGGGEYIFTGLARTGAVLRLAGNTGLPTARLELGAGGFGANLAFDLAAVPGQPGSVAVSYRSELNGYDRSIAIFDGAVPRPVDHRTDSGAGYFYLGFRGDAGRLFTTSPSGFQAFNVNSSGLTLHGVETPDYDGDFVVGNGRVYLASGKVLHPDTRALLADLRTPPGYVALDSERQWICQFNQDRSSVFEPWKVRAYDALTYTQLWVVTFPGIGRVDGAISLGTNGLACRTDAGRVMIVRTPVLSERRADLSVRMDSAPGPTVPDGTLTYTLAVRNEGPWTARNVSLTNRLPSNVAFVSATSNLGQWTNRAGEITCALASLGSGATLTLTVTARAVQAGIVTNRATVGHSALDPIATNNAVEFVTTVNPVPAVSIADATVLEGNNRATVSFNVSLSAASPFIISVPYSTANGTALAGLDFDAASGVVTFPAGARTRTISLASAIRGNTSPGSNRSFYVNLGTPTNATILRGQAAALIVDDDFQSIVIQPVVVAEGDTGRFDAVFNLVLSRATSTAVSVDYAFVDQTAQAGLDYLARPGTEVPQGGLDPG